MTGQRWKRVMLLQCPRLAESFLGHATCISDPLFNIVLRFLFPFRFLFPKILRARVPVQAGRGEPATCNVLLLLITVLVALASSLCWGLYSTIRPHVGLF